MKFCPLFCVLYAAFSCQSVTVVGLVEVSADGGLLHFTPESSWSHWFLLLPVGTELVIGDETVVFRRGPEGELVVQLHLPFASIDASDIAPLVWCELGCDDRIEAVAFDGRCEVTSPPACIRLIPRFRRLTFCLQSGEFVVDPSDRPFADIRDAVYAQRLHRDTPYNVTVTC